MLELRNVTVRPSRSNAAPPVLERVDFAVRPGERVAVMGPNGGGKTTLLRCLCGQVAPCEGAVLLDGAVVGEELAWDALRAAAGLVGQDPDNQIVASRVYDEVAFAPCNRRWDAGTVRSAVDDALGTCGLEGWGERRVGELSGGERQRVALAGVLAARPAYLALDEACSMLDPAARELVRGAVVAAARRGCAVVQVTHELEEAMSCDRVAVVDGGSVVWEGSPAEFLCAPGLLERSACLTTPWLDEALRCVRAGTLDPAFVTEGPEVCAGRLAAGDARSAFARLGSAEAPPAGGVEEGKGRAAVTLEGVGFSYAERRVLRDVRLCVGAGEVLLVAGPSGAGKSTLLGLMAGLLQPEEGAVRLAGGRAPRPGDVGLAFQRPEDQLFASTVLKDVAFGPRRRGAGRPAAAAAARSALGRVGLDPDVFGARSPFALSGGQARRAALAGVLALEAPLYAFDEPTAGLDARGTANFGALVRDLAAAGAGVCVVSHDVERLLPLAHRVAVLGQDGTCTELAGGSHVPTAVARGAGLGVTATARFVQALAARPDAAGLRGGGR
jgi:energy-coupling factor transport system ATP-binding protein